MTLAVNADIFKEREIDYRKLPNKACAKNRLSYKIV